MQCMQHMHNCIHHCTDVYIYIPAANIKLHSQLQAALVTQINVAHVLRCPSIHFSCAANHITLPDLNDYWPW